MARVPVLPHRERGTIRLAPRAYGESRAGRALEVFLPPEAEPRVLVVGGVHGDEPETTAVLSAALRSLAPRSLGCALVLAANPDGVLRGTRANAAGVDINRNFPTLDWSDTETLYSWEPDAQPEVALATGRSPASEPETRGLLELVEELRPRAIVAVHAPLACVDDPAATRLGRWLSELSGLPEVRDIGYATPGSWGTWGRERGVPIVTYELPAVSLPLLVRAHAPVLAELLARGGPP
jgi:protein MpaA